MARPREFDRDRALQDATAVFWEKGFAGTSTDDLLNAMRIGRQSLYNAFGDKRQLYLETLRAYLQRVSSAHLVRLNTPTLPLDGVRDLLVGLTPEDDHSRALGCMGVCSIGEFGATDEEIADLRKRASHRLNVRLVERIKEGQKSGDIDRAIKPDDAATFIQMTMNGLQVAARAGATPPELARLSGFIMERLQAR